MRTRRWRVVGALSVTVTVSYGILYYAFAAFLVPMQRDLGVSAQQLTGAFSLGLLVSGVTGIAVGRHLDRHAAHGLMTAGSIAAALLVLAWSRVEGLVALYALWLALGAVMATVLYEVAFTVLAKTFPEPAERRQAMTAMTLVGALASFVFVPLAQALIDTLGWRDALVVLAAILAATTVPLHLVVLRLPPGSTAPPAPRPRRVCRARARRPALAPVLAPLGGVLPGVDRGHRHDRPHHPVPAGARARRRVRRLRRRAHRPVAAARPDPLRPASRPGCRGRTRRLPCSRSWRPA